jgi:hypothetical protein
MSTDALSTTFAGLDRGIPGSGKPPIRKGQVAPPASRTSADKVRRVSLTFALLSQ